MFMSLPDVFLCCLPGMEAGYSWRASWSLLVACCYDTISAVLLVVLEVSTFIVLYSQEQQQGMSMEYLVLVVTSACCCYAFEGVLYSVLYTCLLLLFS
jgi:hypothetical protein